VVPEAADGVAADQSDSAEQASVANGVTATALNARRVALEPSAGGEGRRSGRKALNHGATDHAGDAHRRPYLEASHPNHIPELKYKPFRLDPTAAGPRLTVHVGGSVDRSPRIVGKPLSPSPSS
jgi:hypothetical protein